MQVVSRINYAAAIEWTQAKDAGTAEYVITQLACRPGRERCSRCWHESMPVAAGTTRAEATAAGTTLRVAYGWLFERLMCLQHCDASEACTDGWTCRCEHFVARRSKALPDLAW